MPATNDLCLNCGYDWGNHMGVRCPNGTSEWNFCEVRKGTRIRVNVAGRDKTPVYWEGAALRVNSADGKNGRASVVSYRADHYKYQRGDNHTADIPQIEVVSQPTKWEDLKPGDLVEVVDTEKLNQVVKATVLMIQQERVVLALDRDSTFESSRTYRLCDDSASSAAAKALGVPANTGFYIYNDPISPVISRVITAAPIQADKPEPGDIVEVTIPTKRDGTLKRQATYIGNEDGQQTVFLHEKLFNSEFSSWGTGKTSPLGKKICALGLNPTQQNCWYVYPGESSVTKVIRKVSEQGKDNSNTMSIVNHKTLKKGDRVRIQFRDKENFAYDMDATVVVYDHAATGETYVYLDEKIDLPNGAGQSAPAANWSNSNLNEALKGMAIDSTASRFYKLGDGGQNYGTRFAKFVKILSRAEDNKSLDKGKDNNKNMDTKSEKKSGSFMERAKSDATKGAWRAGATTLANSAQAGLILAIKANTKMEDSKLEVVSELLKTEGGNAAIRSALGYLLTYAPGIKDMDPRVEILAEEFRVSGMQVGMEGIVGMLTQYLAPALMQALGSLPPIEEVVPPQIRQAVKKTRTRKRVHAETRIAETASPKAEELSTEEVLEASSQSAST